MTLQDRAIFALQFWGLWCVRSGLSLLKPKHQDFLGFVLLFCFYFYIWAAFILMEHKHNPNWAGRSVCGCFECLLSHQLLCLMEQWTCILGPFSVVSSYLLFLVERVTAVTIHEAVRFVKHRSVEVQFSPLSHEEVFKVGWNLFVVGRNAGSGWYLEESLLIQGWTSTDAEIDNSRNNTWGLWCVLGITECCTAGVSFE